MTTHIEPTEEQKQAAIRFLDEYFGEAKEEGDILARLLAEREQPADPTEVTRAVRAADLVFERVGGSSRHYVKECLLPALAAEGLCIIKAKRTE